MRNVIITDIRRSQRKKSYIICMCIVIAMTLGAAIFIRAASFIKTPASVLYSSVCGTISSMFNPFLIGIPIFSSIYSDDFKSRSMQIAIGRGISRTKMMIARFLETVILMAESFLLFSIVLVICGLIDGASGSQIGSCVGGMWTMSFSLITYMALSLLFVYGTMNATTGLILYILLAAKVFDLLIAAVDFIPFLSKNNISLSKYFPGNACSTLGASVKDGDPKKIILWGLGILLAYIILPIFISINIFKKKELDF